MATIETKKPVKEKIDFRLDVDLIKEIKTAGFLTGTDATKIVIAAVKSYKQSDEFKKAIAQHQKELADATAEFSGQRASKADIADTVQAIVTKGDAARKRHRSPSK